MIENNDFLRTSNLRLDALKLDQICSNVTWNRSCAKPGSLTNPQQLYNRKKSDLVWELKKSFSPPLDMFIIPLEIKSKSV